MDIETEPRSLCLMVLLIIIKKGNIQATGLNVGAKFLEVRLEV